jgi:hypothetical protein
MPTKKGRTGAGETILEPLVKALDDLSRSIAALDKTVASLCGKLATRRPKQGPAGSKPGKPAPGLQFTGEEGRTRK